MGGTGTGIMATIGAGIIPAAIGGGITAPPWGGTMAALPGGITGVPWGTLDPTAAGGRGSCTEGAPTPAEGLHGLVAEGAAPDGLWTLAGDHGPAELHARATGMVWRRQ